jgi:hypothetical protein
MNFLFGVYIGGVIVRLLGKGEEKMSVNDVFSLLSWPMYAIIVLVQVVYTNSGAILSKAKSLWNGLTIVWDWVVTRFKKK